MEHVLFGGHRGSGCTDSPHARSSPARAGKPPENTLASIARAYADGADVPGRPSLVELLARKVRAQGPPVGRLVFSSFALSDLIALKRELPEARLGMLCDVPEYAGKEVYPADPEAHARYLPFTPEALREAAREVRLEFVHPELHTLTPEALRTVAELGLGLNCWALREPPPREDRPAIAQALRLAREHRVRLGLITDFVPELRAEVDALPRAPSPGSAR